MTNEWLIYVNTEHTWLCDTVHRDLSSLAKNPNIIFMQSVAWEMGTMKWWHNVFLTPQASSHEWWTAKAWIYRF